MERAADGWPSSQASCPHDLRDGALGRCDYASTSRRGAHRASALARAPAAPGALADYELEHTDRARAASPIAGIYCRLLARHGPAARTLGQTPAYAHSAPRVSVLSVLANVTSAETAEALGASPRPFSPELELSSTTTQAVSPHLR